MAGLKALVSDVLHMMRLIWGLRLDHPLPIGDGFPTYGVLVILPKQQYYGNHVKDGSCNEVQDMRDCPICQEQLLNARCLRNSTLYYWRMCRLYFGNRRFVLLLI